MAKILIVEDEKPIRNLIKRNLELMGHTCMEASDGNEAAEIIMENPFDLMVFDVMLPGKDGFELLELVRIRMKRPTPVIFLTAKESIDDRLKGLSLGADDYISKPFVLRELLLRVQAVLRRTMKEEESLFFDDIEVRFSSKKVFRKGLEVCLTPKEYCLLETLILNRNIVLSREKLLTLVWGYNYEGESRTVDVHIRQIRAKLDLKDRLKTLYKMGYRFELT
ncbi:MAG: response regulator transcription factor [Clostridia bacterium]|jgi:DNA-binding response OmpR family regulator|nr:response regulator transcription factor [Clostridia bacterium]MBO7157232.1 response regulator transcription factor [Clostridia bacterium]